MAKRTWRATEQAGSSAQTSGSELVGFRRSAGQALERTSVSRRERRRCLPDLTDIRGQEAAKRALEVAAAGGHHVLLSGPPGAGKTMLAQRLPGLLPPLGDTEAREICELYAMTGQAPPPGLTRPLRSPPPSVSIAGLVGGGSAPRPGEVSLAHHGVLFLDELSDFRRSVLNALREPLDHGVVSVIRTRARRRFAARFVLVAAMNACLCGLLGNRLGECRCTPRQIDRHRRRVPGPLLDRIHLHVEVSPVTLGELRASIGERSAAVSKRVAGARQIQLARFGRGTPRPVNAAMSPQNLRRHCPLDAAAQRLLDSFFERFALSGRARHGVVSVARTLADLAGAERISVAHIAEAGQYWIRWPSAAKCKRGERG